MGFMPLKFVMIAFVAFLLLPALHAENYVAINSVDGRDVLSGIFYANVKGYPVHFVPVPGGTSDIFATKVGAGHSILLIQSDTLPASGFVESALKTKGNDVEVYSSTDGIETNLALARKSGAQSFIIVDSAYSDSAISVIPYAAQTKSYVILADSTKADQIKEIVAGKKVIIYGYVDKRVRDALSGSNPQTIGTGEDKYEDNIAIVRKTMDEFSLTRPIVTDGSMLEDAIVQGSDPIILTGRLVPTVTYNFIKEKMQEGKITGILLIGNDLVYPMYDMKEKLKLEFATQGRNLTLGVIVKFAQAIPSQQAGMLTLDTFRVPAYVPHLNVTEVVYNKQTKSLMVGLENTGEGALYYTSEVKVNVDGTSYRTFGSTETKLIERGNSQGLDYALDLSAVPEGAVTSSVLVRYGSAKNSLDAYATSDSKLVSITYTDVSNVTVKYAKYDKEKQVVQVTIKNGGDAPVFVFVKLLLKDENGVPTTIGAASIRQVDTNSLYVEEFPLILSEKEIQLNKEASVSVEYGGRRGFLNKQATYVVPLETASAAPTNEPSALVGAFAAIAILLIIYGIYRFIASKKK